MNAPPSANAAAIPFRRRFFWLLKRELWEQRRRTLRTPLIIGGVMLGLTVLGILTSELLLHRQAINIDDMNLSQINQVLQTLSPGQIGKISAALLMASLSMSVPIVLCMIIVAFFYLINALYEDRHDRSVLFWKSLPISDWETVLSKVVFAAVVIPAAALLAIAALQIGFLCVIAIYAALHGINALPLLWMPGAILGLWLKLLVLIALNALWALPTIGWLLLCSAFARSKPFAWAVALPAIVGGILNWLQIAQNVSLSDWYWRNIFARILFGVVPTGGLGLRNAIDFGTSHRIYREDLTLDRLASLLSFDALAGVLASPALWIGVAAGVAMILAAIWLRRRRIETHA